MHAGGYFRYNTQYLEQLPIKLQDIVKESAIEKEIAEKVNQILELKKQIPTIEEKIKRFPESYFAYSWNFDKLANIIKASTLSRESYSISAKSFRTDYKQRDLDGSETFRIILAKNEFIDFYSEEIASYVFEKLKNMSRITKRELLELQVPQQPHLKNLLNQYRKDKEQIVKDGKAIDEIEKKIDDLVYESYDITYKERKIIGDYLKKF
jgi:hypothetical protein